MRLINIGNIFIVAIILFILGLSVGVYNGDELKYEGLKFNNTDSTINLGISKIVDGTLTISYEIANMVGEGAIREGIDLNRMVDLFILLFWIGIVLVSLASLGKIFLYIYILGQEIKMAKKERVLLGIEDDEQLKEYYRIEKGNRFWYYIVGGIILLLIILLILL